MLMHDQDEKTFGLPAQETAYSEWYHNQTVHFQLPQQPHKPRCKGVLEPQDF